MSKKKAAVHSIIRGGHYITQKMAKLIIMLLHVPNLCYDAFILQEIPRFLPFQNQNTIFLPRAILPYSK